MSRFEEIAKQLGVKPRQVQVRMTDDEHAQLKDLAAETGVTLSTLIRACILLALEEKRNNSLDRLREKI